ncbi:MAG: tRNA pseudouridine(55) synthase TruB [Chloroflexi bacterium]|nr:tRNA pseudouridine(55) synthase TruB [Chloroflexota bacterium]
MAGLLNLYKPQGPTSHDLVDWVRRGTRQKKVGHAGTLDPNASGVLILCLGFATRLSEYVMESPKTYRARLRLGIETDTYDALGAVVAENPAPVVREAVEAALVGFRGEIQQVPPMYSALKQGGKKLYDLARAGKEVERAPRTVTISRLELLAWEPPFVTLEVDCSPGTYIRSLAFDLGRVLGVGAHLAALERTASGSFRAEDAVRWPDFESAMQAGTWTDHLLSADRALAFAPALYLTAEQTQFVCTGRSIPAAVPGEDAALSRAYDPAGRFIAVLGRHADQWTPYKVFDHAE